VAAAIASLVPFASAQAQEMKLADFLPPQHAYQEQVYGVLIDGTATYAFRLGEVANFVTSGMHASISPFALFMNRGAYRGLSDEHRAAFDQIGQEISMIANDVQLAGVARGKQMFQELDGKEWIELTPEAAAEFNAASAGVVEQVVAAAEAEGLNARAYIAALGQ